MKLRPGTMKIAAAASLASLLTAAYGTTCYLDEVAVCLQKGHLLPSFSYNCAATPTLTFNEASPYPVATEDGYFHSVYTVGAGGFGTVSVANWPCDEINSVVGVYNAWGHNAGLGGLNGMGAGLGFLCQVFDQCNGNITYNTYCSSVTQWNGNSLVPAFTVNMTNINYTAATCN